MQEVQNKPAHPFDNPSESTNPNALSIYGLMHWIAKTFLGLGFLLLILGVIFWWVSATDLKNNRVALAKQNFHMGSTYLAQRKTDCIFWVQMAMVELMKSNQKEALGWKPSLLLGQGSTGRMILLKTDGKIIRNKKIDSSEQDDTLFDALVEGSPLFEAVLVSKNSLLKPVSSFFWLEDRLYLATFGAVRNSYVGHVILIVPINASWLKSMKKSTGVEMGIVSPVESVVFLQQLHEVGTGMFAGIVQGKNLLPYMVPGQLSSLQTTFEDAGRYSTNSMVLYNHERKSQGILLFVEKLPSVIFSSVMHISAILTACIGFCLLLLSFWRFRVLKKALLGNKDYIQQTATFLNLSDNMYGKNIVRIDNGFIGSKEIVRTPQVVKTYPQYQRFFDNSQSGLFICTPHGALLQINQTFAAMLGYDSVMHLLTTHASFFDLSTNQEEMQQILQGLREQPGTKRKVSFTTAMGTTRSFWLVSIAMLDVDSETPIEGFLIDRTIEQRRVDIEAKYDALLLDRSNLCLLLASATWQAMAFFLSEDELHDVMERRQLEEKGDIANVARNPKERRASHIALKAIFQDIYQFALHEAEEEAAQFSASLHLRRLLAEIQYQISLTILRKNLSFECVVAEDTPENIISFGPLLRHVLLRSVLFVAYEVEGGDVALNVRGDYEFLNGFIFSISWEKRASGVTGITSHLPQDMSEVGANTGDEQRKEEQEKETSFPFQHENEYAVIDYLVQKLKGKILNHRVEEKTRFIQIFIPFEFIEPDRSTLKGLVDDEKVVFSEQNELESFNTEGINRFISGSIGDAGFEYLQTLTLSDSLPETLLEENQPGWQILLVDDDPQNRLLFSLYLRGLPHIITEAEDGLEALALYRQKSFDVIFMDLEMPKLDGFQTMQVIRALEADNQSPPVSIVVQTAHALPAMKAQCMALGCAGFLLKPYSRNSLLNMFASIAKNMEAIKANALK